MSDLTMTQQDGGLLALALVEAVLTDERDAVCTLHAAASREPEHVVTALISALATYLRKTIGAPEAVALVTEWRQALIEETTCSGC